MAKIRVYLTGPITGHSSEEIIDWRQWLTDECSRLEFIDPTKAVYDSSVGYMQTETPSEALKRLTHGKLVVDRNKLLIRNSDVLLANFLGAKSRVSIGSVGEMFLASAYGKPIILIRESAGNIHDHAMINAIASQICHTIEEGKAALLNFSGQSLRTA